MGTNRKAAPPNTAAVLTSKHLYKGMVAGVGSSLVLDNATDLHCVATRENVPQALGCPLPALARPLSHPLAAALPE